MTKVSEFFEALNIDLEEAKKNSLWKDKESEDRPDEIKDHHSIDVMRKNGEVNYNMPGHAWNWKDSIDNPIKSWRFTPKSMQKHKFGKNKLK